MKAPTLISALIFCMSLQSFAKDQMTIQQYIDTYAALAVSEMESSKVPASVTLAQGILESHFGNSYLARDANNHFGIKCHKSWTGKKVYRDDDKKNECFRKYGHPVQSFRDHSSFLQSPRYAFLFELDRSDYVGWCYGLKEAGYATDKNYPERLVDLIERYQLTQFDAVENRMLASAKTDHSTVSETRHNTKHDNQRNTSAHKSKESRKVSVGAGKLPKYTSRSAKRSKNKVGRWIEKVTSQETVLRPESGMNTRVMQSETFYFNNIRTVVVTEKCTPMQIARTYGMSVTRLCKYNEFDSNTIIPPQTKIYLQPKRSMGPITDETVRVAEGQTMESISHYYGVKLKSLYKRNKLRVGTQPATGEVIYLRGKNPRVPKTVVRERLAIKNNRFIQTPGERSANRDIEITNPTSYEVPEPKNADNASSAHRWNPATENRTAPKSNDTYTNSATSSTTKSSGTTSFSDYNSNSSNYEEPTSTSDSPPMEPDGIIVGSLDDQPTIINGREVPARSHVETTSHIVVTEDYDQPRIVDGKMVGGNATNTSNIVVLEEDRTVSSSGRTKLYTVRKGDTLWGLSMRFGVKVERIKTINKLKSNSLAIGQELRIPMQ